MDIKNSYKTAVILRNTARYGLLFFTILLFVFALLSGSEDYGGGIAGILKNGPNALPWVALFFLLFLAWKKELVGGIAVLVFGLALLIFFYSKMTALFWVPLVISITIILFGLSFITSWYLRKRMT